MGLAGPLSVVRNKACSPSILYVVLVHVRSPELSQSDRFAYEIILHSLRQQGFGKRVGVSLLSHTGEQREARWVLPVAVISVSNKVQSLNF